MNHDDLVNRFTYHPPQGDQPDLFQTIRQIALAFAIALNEMVPESREKSLAITKLEEVVFWANAGIARDATQKG